MSGMTPFVRDWIEHCRKVHPPKSGMPIMPDESCNKCVEYDLLNSLDYDLAKEE